MRFRRDGRGRWALPRKTRRRSSPFRGVPTRLVLVAPLLAALAACGGAQGDLWSLDAGLELEPAPAGAKPGSSKSDCRERYGTAAASQPDAAAAPPTAGVTPSPGPQPGSGFGPGAQPIAGAGGGWSSSATDELDELVLFPRFVVGAPGLGAYSPACELADDPYGNCL